MRKVEEEVMLVTVAEGFTPRDVGERMGVPWKRTVAWCRKWAAKGWYDCGVSDDLGWLTPEGRAEVARIKGDAQ